MREHAPLGFQDEVRSAENLNEGLHQCLALLVRTYGNAQVLVDAGQSEMTHDDATFPQLRGQFARIVPWVAGEYEIGRRRQDVESEGLQMGDQRCAAFHYGLPCCFEVFLVLQGGGCSYYREAIEGVGIKAVLDAFQRLDERGVAHRVADAQASERV